MSISLTLTHSELSWPSPGETIEPSGEGARIFAKLAKDKIGRALSRFDDAKNADVGVLLADSHAIATERPLAIVVNFPGQAADETLRELQRLAWNFSHSP